MFTEKDHLEILNLYARINRSWDEGNAAEFADCFTDDASYERPYVGSGLITRGRSELAELVHKQVAKKSEPMKHVALNILIRAEGDGAKGNCDHFVITSGSNDNPPRFHATGRCEDTFVRTPNGWRVALRVKKHEFTE